MNNLKLEVNGISKRFSGGKEGVTALEDISLKVSEGEIVSLIGPSGCGKSTLLDIIAGLLKPDRGEVIIDGSSVLGKNGVAGYMPQKDVLFPWRTVLENVLVPCEIRGDNQKAARVEAQALLPSFGLTKFADAYPYQLSGGMRQRVSFLRSYMCKKDVMLLDEPFGKLDALTRMEMQQWFLGKCREFGHTVLLVTHDIEEAVLLSDRVYVVSPRPGRIIAEVPIPLGRPRTIKLNTTPEFIQAKSQLLSYFEEGLLKAE